MIGRSTQIVLHIITGLGDGGAEAVLYSLISKDKTHRHTVISLSGDGKYGRLLRGVGADVITLGMSPAWPPLAKFARLVKLIRAIQPSVVQTWLYHADLVGGLAARLAGQRAIYWGLHNSTIDQGGTKLSTRIIVRLNAILSPIVPRAIVSCSEKGAEVHVMLGYAADKMNVINNGYDLSKFRPKAAEGLEVRDEFSVPSGAPLFGCVARDDPYKDHQNLLKAFTFLTKLLPEARLILVGNGMTAANPRISHLITVNGLGEHVLLAGRRDDVPKIMNALDALVLSSSAEAFPNVLSEAMACGTPCASTDVGDSAIIVGPTGEICPPSDCEALARAMYETYRRSREEPDLSHRCRKRIMEKFSIEKMVGQYANVWRGELN